jgi:hypothetical protein
MNCQRCDSMWGDEAAFRIRTEMLDMQVCEKCAMEARKLGLLTEPFCRDVEIARRPVEPGRGNPAHA